MITATITKVIRKRSGITVTVNFSDTHDEVNPVEYGFDGLSTSEDIIKYIKDEVDARNASQYQVGNLNSLVGTVVESDPIDFSELKTKIDLANSGISEMPVDSVKPL